MAVKQTLDLRGDDEMKDHYLQKAEENLPELFVKAVRVEQKADAFRQGDSVTLDLANHYVDYLSFHTGYTEMYPDAPVHLCFDSLP